MPSPPTDEAASPAFTPVPARSRRDGWTADRQRAFLAELQASRCIGRAAGAAGMSRESAYRLRRRPGAESFSAAWDRIMAACPPAAPDADSLWYRALYGVMIPILRGGEVVAHLHRPDNRAAMALLGRFDRAAARADRAKGHAAENALGRQFRDLSDIPPGPELDALLAIEAKFEGAPSFASAALRSRADAARAAEARASGARATNQPVEDAAGGTSQREKRARPSTS